MIDKYDLTAKLMVPLLQAFRDSYGTTLIEDCMADAFAIAKAQYYKETAEAKRKAEEEKKASNDRDKMKQLLLASMKALRSLDDDPAAKFMTDEYLDNMLTDEVLDFATKISEALTDASKNIFDEAFKIQEKERKNGSTTTHTSNNNTDDDSDDDIINAWMSHQNW